MVRSTLALVALVAASAYAAPLPHGGKLLTLPSILPLITNITGLDKRAEAAPWYKESAAADDAGLAKRAEAAPWYKESAAADDAGLAKRAEAAPWYKESAAADDAGLAKRAEAAPWYKESAAADDAGLAKRAEAAPWYKESAAADDAGLAKRAEAAPWYKESSAADDAGLSERAEAAPWYKESSAADDAGLSERAEAAPWYKESSAADDAGLSERAEAASWYKESSAVDDAGLSERAEAASWYKESSAADSAGLDKRDAADAVAARQEQLKREVFGNMRKEHLKVSAEKGKAFFQFTIHPKNDTVDRWNIPAAIKRRYDDADGDADRVSILNYYLMETGREIRSAAELGFKPTMALPGLAENGNEVGFGYAYAGQHQSHCVEFLANAIEIGKANLHDFYLFHVIHCLSLIKLYSLQLHDKEPFTTLTPVANALVQSHFPQSIN
ncbi:hypothetical protein ACHAPC_011025 [Botrytis cinerea]